MTTRSIRVGAVASFSLAWLSAAALQGCGTSPVSMCGANCPNLGGTAGAFAGAAGTPAGSGGTSNVAGASGAGVSGGGTNSTGGTGGSAGSSGSAGSGTSGGGATAGGSAGMAAVAGSGGAGPDKCEVPPDGSLRKAPAFPPTAITNPTGIVFRFMNNCPMKLWVNTSNPTYAFPGGVVELESKAVKEYDMPQGVLQRVQTYKNAAPGAAGSVQIQFMEMNAEKNKALNYNLSGVDWVGLPVEIKGIGASADCGVTGCYQPLASLLKDCPTQLLDTVNGKCIAPFHYCSDAAHKNEAFCTVLDAAAANVRANDPDCKQVPGTPTTSADIFGCAGAFWGAQAACCAKVHRGVTGVNASMARDNCAYYKNPPYDVYSAWSHKVCPFIYSFAYDDFHEQSGFHTCTKGTELDITYCPGDPG